MDKKDIARLGIEIASRELGLSEIELVFKDKAFFSNPDINGLFIQLTYTIVMNQDWLEKAKEIEILICVFHEMRHAYQKACIEYPHLMKIDVPKYIVDKWKSEFDQYKNPSNTGYLEQEIEKDAIKFSKYLINKIGV